MLPITIGDSCEIYNADALAIIDALVADGRTVDAIITDPPYSSGGAFRADRTQETSKKYVQTQTKLVRPEFSGDNRDQRSFHFWSALWLSAALRLCKPGSPVLLFSDWRQLPVSTDYLQAGGAIWRGVVPWNKTTQVRPAMGRFASQCEYVVWGSVGPMPVERGVGCLWGFYEYPEEIDDELARAMPGGFTVPVEKDKEHITQKPLRLMEDMVEIVPPGATILDPFMGSGTTGVAAVKRGRKFIGCEQSPENFEIARRRLAESTKQGSLFDAG